MFFSVLIFSLSVALTDIILLGGTGVGKSSVANEIMRFKNGDGNFVESISSRSYTKDTYSEVVGDVRVTDTPGLQDSKGESFDADNIKNVVTYCKKLGHLNAFVVVLPENPRLDAATLKGIKLYVDSFGNETLSRIGFVFNKVYDTDKKELDGRAGEIRNNINTYFGSHCDFRFWHINYRSEKRKYISEEGRDAINKDTRDQIGKMLAWVSQLEPYSTKYAVFGEYEHARLLREAEEKRQHEQRLREEAERKREEDEKRHAYERSVISRWLEHRNITVLVNQTPKYEMVRRSSCSTKYFLFFKVGRKCHRWMEKKHIGTTVEITKQNEKREMIKYGSQEIRSGDWIVDGKKWVETFEEKE